MSIENAVQSAKQGVRSALAIAGVLGIAAGVLVLVWPQKTAVVLAAVLGIYAVVVGLFYIGIGIASASASGWRRFGEILLGALYILAGLIFLSNLGAAVSALMVVVPIMIGVLWLVQGITSFTHLSSSESKVWQIFYGAVSLIAGLALMFAPVFYAPMLWWIVGISLLVIGAVQLVRSFQL